MTFIGNILKNGAKGLLGPVKDILDEVITNKEELAEVTLRIKQQEAELEQSYLADVANARKMNADVQNSATASFLAKNINPLLAVAIIGLTFGIFYILIFQNIDKDKENVTYYLLGVLNSFCAGIISFYFGSSQGSKKKEIQIDELIKQR